MISSRSFSMRVCAVLGLVWFGSLAGCDSDPPTAAPPPSDLGTSPTPDSQPLPADTYRLTIIGPSSFTLNARGQATLKVGYMKNETNLPGKAISFTIKGDARDAVLTTFTSVTDSLGAAETIVAAGELPTTFQVEASASRATPVTFFIQTAAPPPPVPRVGGVFTVVSNFDISTQFSGTTLGDVLNLLDEMSNHPDDPGRFVVDIVFDQAFKNLDPAMQATLTFFKPLLYSEVQNLLMKFAPTMVTDLKAIAKNLSDLARRFQVTSSIISATEQPTDQLMVVSHKLEKIGWTLNGKKKEYGYADLGLKHPQVDSINMVLGNGTALSISEHTFPLQLGSFLLVALDELVVPLINPKASNLAGLMAGWVDCTAVGTTINNTVGMLGQPFWTGACGLALTAVGGLVEQQITKINLGTSSLSLAGNCQLFDQNHDAAMDTMLDGLWTGTFTLGGNTANITGAGNNFSGTRSQ